ncbi:MAG: DUF1569 domain-containing protein [Gemmataceae bacterium]
MPVRRQLRFDTLADAVRDAEALLANGYDKVGKWSLGQCCGHLANWLTYPIDGFPKIPLLLRPVMWALRNTVGRRKYETYVREQTFPSGAPTVPQSVPTPDADDTDGVAKLKAAAERYEAYTGPLHPSPLFGPLTKDEARKMQLVHCAHHLSFLGPKG